MLEKRSPCPYDDDQHPLDPALPVADFTSEALKLVIIHKDTGLTLQDTFPRTPKTASTNPGKPRPLADAHDKAELLASFFFPPLPTTQRRATKPAMSLNCSSCSADLSSLWWTSSSTASRTFDALWLPLPLPLPPSLLSPVRFMEFNIRPARRRVRVGARALERSEQGDVRGGVKKIYLDPPNVRAARGACC